MMSGVRRIAVNTSSTHLGYPEAGCNKGGGGSQEVCTLQMMKRNIWQKHLTLYNQQKYTNRPATRHKHFSFLVSKREVWN